MKTGPATALILLALVTSAVAVDSSSPADDTLGSQLAESQAWVTIFDPDRAWNGYTLAFYANRIPILFDMNGRIVHRWPAARVKSRLRLLEDGHLLAIALGRGVVEYDWQGQEVWRWEADHGFAHHDVIRLGNGNTVTLIRPDKGRFDDIVEVDPDGKIVWQWDSADHLEPYILPKGWSKVDVTHLNSIQELPANRSFDQGDQRFRPGNFLVSSREMNLVFIIDKLSGDLVWTYRGDLEKQHEPLMIGPESPRAGNILIFNNRYGSFYADRQSSVLEIDPSTGTLLWQFRSDGFFSPTSGVEQPLPNGNVLITSSRGGRTFEITRGGRTVWEWSPPFDTTRSGRYAWDHCPQLASLDRPELVAVRPEAGYRHIDTDVYRFARRGLRRDLRLEDRKLSVLKYNNDCRSLVLPLGARAQIAYGLHPARFQPQDRTQCSIEFRVEFLLPGAEEPVQVLSEILRPAADTWRETTLDLGEFALQKVDLCLRTEALGCSHGAAVDEYALWQQPIIEGFQAGAAPITEDDLPLGELTPEELEARKKHLEALGYIN